MHRLIIKLIILCLVPGWSWALGLGQAEVFSTLGQPLNARIPILLAANETTSNIKVQLASDIDFVSHEIPKPAWLKELQFKIVATDGKPFIEVTSSQNINDPALYFLLQLDSPVGKIVSANTILLPPGKIEDAQLLYGPIQSHETLLDIADKIQPNQQVTITQTLAALFLANPTAFAHGNLNGIKAGKKLRIPSLDAIQAISQQRALAVINEHKRAWLSSTKEPQPGIGAIAPVESNIGPTQFKPIETSAAVTAEPTATNSEIATEQQLRLDQQHNLLIKAQANIDQLTKELDAAKQQRSELSQQLQVKETEVATLKNQVANLTRSIATQAAVVPINKSSGFSWSLIGLLILAGIAAYLYKTNRLNFELLQNMPLKWPAFLQKYLPKSNKQQVPDIEPIPASYHQDDKQLTASEPVRKKGVEPVLDKAPTIEPVEEAGIYFAYGRYEQAQRVLQNAIEKKPDRLDFKQKLLEIHAAKGDKSAFEHYANQIRQDLAVDKPEFWQFIHELHRKTWSDRPAAQIEENKTISPESVQSLLQEQNIKSQADEIVLSDEDVIATKLEMARSCIEIGAIQDAQKLLNDVQKYGDEAQCREAERLLQRITECA